MPTSITGSGLINGLALPTDSIQPGVVLITSQTIGNAVQSFTITNVFSDEYENYRIVLSGGSASGSSDGSIKLGSTSTGYYNSGVYSNYNGAGPSVYASNNGGNSGTIWAYNPVAGINLDMMLYQPYQAHRTSWTYLSSTQGGSTNRWSGGGFLDDDTTQYTSITFQTQGTHTVTGGNVRIYGYRNT
jgi:hypothetical protein